MGEKFKLDGQEYDTSSLGDVGLKNLELLKFAIKRNEELENTQALLQKAKKGYIESLKREIISQKAGFIIDNE